jgi:hypothetical protein
MTIYEQGPKQTGACVRPLAEQSTDIKPAPTAPSASSVNDPYLYEQFKESFRDHCDRHDPEPTEYDWLKGFGRLWRDAIDAARSTAQREVSK